MLKQLPPYGPRREIKQIIMLLNSIILHGKMLAPKVVLINGIILTIYIQLIAITST